MTPAETHWPAPAKLNLFLHVTGRRADGYHELQTLFQLIDLCDTIAISVREDGRIEVDEYGRTTAEGHMSSACRAASSVGPVKTCAPPTISSRRVRDACAG